MLATLGPNGVPMVIGQYRERGILRRLGVTPVRPYVLSQSPTAGALGITAGVAVAAGGWIMWMINLHPGWTERRRVMEVYFTGQGTAQRRDGA